MRAPSQRGRAPGGALVALAALALIAAAAGCGAAGDTPSGGAGPRVVASESFLADIVRHVAGDRGSVGVLVPHGADPHSFEPGPGDLADVARADLLVVNGGGLEGPLIDTLRNAAGTTTVVEAAAGLPSRTPRPGEQAAPAGDTDPHFWMDPTLVTRYVANIRDALSTADPDGAATYAANAAAYTAELEALDQWVRTRMAEIPEKNRTVVTNHASLGYFADRYGLRIAGTVIPGVGTGETPTAQQLGALTARIRNEGVRAIIVESGEDPRLARQIAAETGVALVTGLLDHSLSAPGGAAPTYIDMIKHDAAVIVEALR